MTIERAFPVIYSDDVESSTSFYSSLGFAEFYRHPVDAPPTFVSLRRNETELAISLTRGQPKGEHMMTTAVELFVFVRDADLDPLITTLRTAGVPIASEPTAMPWGDRVARVTDPDGNTVALASERVGPGR